MSLILPGPVEEFRRQNTANRIAQQIRHIVEEAFPGHEFSITVEPAANGKGGTVFIDHEFLKTKKGKARRYVVKDPHDDLVVVHQCGEILERLGLPRGPAEPGWQVTARARMKAGTFDLKDS